MNEMRKSIHLIEMMMKFFFFDIEQKTSNEFRIRNVTRFHKFRLFFIYKFKVCFNHFLNFFYRFCVVYLFFQNERIYPITHWKIH